MSVSRFASRVFFLFLVFKPFLSKETERKNPHNSLNVVELIFHFHDKKPRRKRRFFSPLFCIWVSYVSEYVNHVWPLLLLLLFGGEWKKGFDDCKWPVIKSADDDDDDGSRALPFKFSGRRRRRFESISGHNHIKAPNDHPKSILTPIIMQTAENFAIKFNTEYAVIIH